MSANEYINRTGRKIIQYHSPDSITIELPFILTQNKILTRRMPYMLLEKRTADNYIAAVRLVDYHVNEGIVSLDVQELANNRDFTLSWNLEYNGDWWLWSLADYESLILQSEGKQIQDKI